MRSINYRIITISLAFLIFSCSEKNELKDVLTESIIIDEDNPIEILFSQVFDTCYFVPLDEEAIIGEITQLNIGEKYISILDARVSKNVYLFDLEGNLESTISEEGEGPGQYIFPQYFDISDSDNKISLYSNGTRKILNYASNGDFISEYDISEFGNFKTLKAENDFFLTGISEGEGNQINYFSYLDSEFSKQTFVQLPDEIMNISDNIGKVNYFYEEMSGDGFFYQPVYSTDFIKFDKNGVEKVFRFNFSSRGIYNSNSNLPKSDYQFISKRDGLVYLGDNHLDGGNVLFLDLSDSGQGALGVFDKTSNKGYKVSKLVNDMSLMMNLNAIPGSYNNQPGYLSIAIPYSIFDQIRSQVDFSENLYKDIIKDVNSKDGESFVLMIYKIKKKVDI